MERNQIACFSKNCSIQCTTVLFLDNGDTVTNPYDIDNTFNNYFASIAETTKKSIKYSHKNFSGYPMKVLVHYFCNLLIEKK